MAELFTLVGKIAIDATVANQTIDGTMTLVGELNNSLQGVEAQADSTGKSLGSKSKLSAGAIFFGNMATKLATVSWKMIKDIGKAGFEHNALMESLTKSFSVYMNGNEDAAKHFADQLYQLAKITPLNVESIGLGAKQLMAAGMSAEETLEVLQMWGDVSLGDNNKFSSLVRTHSKILADERVMAKELNSMTDTGVPIRQYIADYLGISTGKLAEQVKGGEVPSGVITEVLRGLTDESGLYFNKMGVMMTTYDGQVEKLGDTATQTAGSVSKPFFDIAASDVLPRLSSSLAEFYDWTVANQSSISGFADAVGDLVTNGLDGLIAAFKWIINNQAAVTVGVGAIGAALVANLAKSHPYITAIAGVVGGLQWLENIGKEANEREKQSEAEYMATAPKQTFYERATSEGGTLSLVDEKTQREQLKLLQDYVDAKHAYDTAVNEGMSNDVIDKLEKVMNQRLDLADPHRNNPFYINGLYESYMNWAQITEHDPYNVMLGVDPESEEEMQSKISGMDLEAVVELRANTTGVYSAIAAINGAKATMQLAFQGVVNAFKGDHGGGVGASFGVPSHAKGLDFVPRDGYLARLHYGEAVLNRSTADMLRNGGMGNTSRLEAAINRVEGLLQSIANNTSTGQTLALDTGVLVGQITPMIDRRLGTISNRKGRG